MSNEQVTVTQGRQLTKEYLAMNPLQKWETLALNGLLGTNEPWIDDMRQTLRGLQGTPPAQAREAMSEPDYMKLLFELDVAATTFEKVEAKEYREGMFNAEHAKLLRSAISALSLAADAGRYREALRIEIWNGCKQRGMSDDAAMAMVKTRLQALQGEA